MNKKLTPLESLQDLSKLVFIYGGVQQYKIIEKSLKALENIKEKEVNVFIFLHSGDLETYNEMVEDNRKLRQDEYDLLKEVLL